MSLTTMIFYTVLAILAVIALRVLYKASEDALKGYAAQINTICIRAYVTAKNHGFYEGDINSLEFKRDSLDLITGEVIEAISALVNDDLVENRPKTTGLSKTEAFEIERKDTLEDELADIVILAMSFCGAYHIDLQKAIEEKMWYNSTRPYLHGKRESLKG